jgi:hypothetical protein
MNNFSLIPSGYILNSDPSVQEAQSRVDSVTVDSLQPNRSTSVVLASAVQQRSVEMPSMQARLMRQLEAGPSNQPLQQRVPHPAAAGSSTVSGAGLSHIDVVDQRLLAELRQKANVNLDNTPLTKAYCCDVLEELARWLPQHTIYSGVHSLTDLLDYVDNHPGFGKIVSYLEENFINSGKAPVLMGKPGPAGRPVYVDLIPIIEALNLSRREPHITLPSAAISRQDEQLLHSIHRALVGGGMKDTTASVYIAALKHFCIWLEQQKLAGVQIPHGLDSLEKVLGHHDPQLVKDVVDGFKAPPDTTKPSGCHHARTAINKLRQLKRMPPLPRKVRARAQPTLRQPVSARAQQPANLAPPHTPSLGGPAFVAEATALPSTASAEAGSSRYGVWRPVPGSQDASRNVRPRVEPAQSEQSANLVQPHGSGMVEPDIRDEELAFLVEPATTEDEFDFFNNLFK